MPIKAVLIDHDGTLVDSEICHYQMWVRVLQTFGVPLSETAYKKHYAGIPTPANAAAMTQRYRLDSSAEQLVEQKTISAYGLEEYVSSFVSGDDVTHSKPAPDVIYWP